MRAYLITNAFVFALIIAAHIAKLLTHDVGAIYDTGFIASSAVSIVLFVWAIILIRKK
jgi:hypothetical protein